MSHREPVSLPLNHCVVCPLKTWEHFFCQIAQSDLRAGGLFVSSLASHVTAPMAELPGSRATMAGSENVLCIEQRYRCRLNQMAVRCEDGALPDSANYRARDADSSQLQTTPTSLIVNLQLEAHPWMDEPNIHVPPSQSAFYFQPVASRPVGCSPVFFCCPTFIQPNVCSNYKHRIL